MNKKAFKCHYPLHAYAVAYKAVLDESVRGEYLSKILLQLNKLKKEAFGQIRVIYKRIEGKKNPNIEKYWKQVKFLEKLGLYSTLDDKKRLMP